MVRRTTILPRWLDSTAHRISTPAAAVVAVESTLVMDTSAPLSAIEQWSVLGTHEMASACEVTFEL
jgi:hypothetical protein